jgi:hypothetical protein
MRTLALILSLVAALSGWYGYWGHSKAEASAKAQAALGIALRDEQRAHGATQAAMLVQQKQKAAVFVAKENTNAKVRKAISTEADWAGAVVPSSVLDAAGL